MRMWAGQSELFHRSGVVAIVSRRDVRGFMLQYIENIGSRIVSQGRHVFVNITVCTCMRIALPGIMMRRCGQQPANSLMRKLYGARLSRHAGTLS